MTNTTTTPLMPVEIFVADKCGACAVLKPYLGDPRPAWLTVTNLDHCDAAGYERFGKTGSRGVPTATIAGMGVFNGPKAIMDALRERARRVSVAAAR